MFIHHEVWKALDRLTKGATREDRIRFYAVFLPLWIPAVTYPAYINPFGLRWAASRILGTEAAALLRTVEEMRRIHLEMWWASSAKAASGKGAAGLAAERRARTQAVRFAVEFAGDASGRMYKRALLRKAISKGVLRAVPFVGWGMLAYDAYTVVRHGTFWGVDVPGVPEGGWV